MTKRVIHVTEAEAASDFASLLARVRASEPAPPVRLLSECLRIARERGSNATVDADFAKDVEAAVNSHREPLNPPEWD